MNKLEECEMNKNVFFDIYEKAKNNKIEINTIPPETYKKICILLKEEIKLKKQAIEKIKKKLNVS